MAGFADFERDQIRVCRVLCIFFMMSVHVDPGAGTAPILATGFWHIVTVVWVDVLGRASVAALSFISGYLLVRTAAEKGFGDFARGKFTTLIVPMVVWNLSLVALLLGGEALVGHPESTDLWQGSLAARIGLWTGLTGPTENLSLFFLRDLFVAGLVVYWLRPALRRWPVAVVGVILVLTIGEWTAPVIFRPSILAFSAAGAAVAYRIGWLRDLTRPGIIGPVVSVAGVLLIICAVVPRSDSLALAHATDILRRGLLTAGVICVSAALVGTSFGRWLSRLENGIFETYLLHVNLLSILWIGWLHFIGGPEVPSYLLFFFGAPVVAMVVGQWFAGALNGLPPWAQVLLRGKAKGRRKAPRPVTRTEALAAESDVVG